MRFRSAVFGVLIAAVSSLATWQWAAAQDTAPTQRIPGTFAELGIQPSIKTGGDIGFRVDYMERNKAMGRLVVRVNGQWVDAELGVRVTPLEA